jgi:predicted DsbA family dithiol-disulfide isomerase
VRAELPDTAQYSTDALFSVGDEQRVMSQTAADEEVIMFSDYVCPFCYLGKASLEQYQDEREEPIEVEWHPFDLRGYKRGPDGEVSNDVADGKDEDYFAQVRENVERLKEEYDVEMDLDYSMDVDSWNAQQASLFVRREHPEEFADFHDAVYEALWTEGKDIGDSEVLAQIAAECDVDPDGVREATQDRELEAELEERFESAQEAGVTGVPTFAYDGQGARGAVPPTQLRRLIEGAEN